MTDHKAAKEWAKRYAESWLEEPTIYESSESQFARAYLDLTAQLAAKDAMIVELVARVQEYKWRCDIAEDVLDWYAYHWQEENVELVSTRAQEALDRIGGME